MSLFRFEVVENFPYLRREMHDLVVMLLQMKVNILPFANDSYASSVKKSESKSNISI